MFGLIGSLARAAVSVVTVPVAVLSDVVTLGGSLTDKPEPYTADAVSAVVESLAEITSGK